MLYELNLIREALQLLATAVAAGFLLIGMTALLRLFLGR